MTHSTRKSRRIGRFAAPLAGLLLLGAGISAQAATDVHLPSAQTHTVAGAHASQVNYRHHNRRGHSQQSHYRHHNRDRHFGQRKGHHRSHNRHRYSHNGRRHHYSNNHHSRRYADHRPGHRRSTFGFW